MAAVEIRELRPSDGAEVRALWQASGVRIRPGDDDVSLARLLSHNPGLCLVGCGGDRLVDVGTGVGHTLRRVAPSFAAAIGVDATREMLDAGRTVLAGAGVAN